VPRGPRLSSRNADQKRKGGGTSPNGAQSAVGSAGTVMGVSALSLPLPWNGISCRLHDPRNPKEDLVGRHATLCSPGSLEQRHGSTRGTRPTEPGVSCARGLGSTASIVKSGRSIGVVEGQQQKHLHRLWRRLGLTYSI